MHHSSEVRPVGLKVAHRGRVPSWSLKPSRGNWKSKSHHFSLVRCLKPPTNKICTSGQLKKKIKKIKNWRHWTFAQPVFHLEHWSSNFRSHLVACREFLDPALDTSSVRAVEQFIGSCLGVPGAVYFFNGRFGRYEGKVQSSKKENYTGSRLPSWERATTSSCITRSTTQSRKNLASALSSWWGTALRLGFHSILEWRTGLHWLCKVSCSPSSPCFSSSSRDGPSSASLSVRSCSPGASRSEMADGVGGWELADTETKRKRGGLSSRRCESWTPPRKPNKD